MPVVIVAGLAASGCQDQEPEASVFPTSDWTGTYATASTGSSTDCREAGEPQPLKGFLLQLQHLVSRQARVQMPLPPFTRLNLEGSFRGDRLEARGEIEQPISLPDSILSRLTPADSLDIVGYTLEAEFGADSFSGEYTIRAIDLHALVIDGESRRCENRYQLTGHRSGSPLPAVPGASP